MSWGLVRRSATKLYTLMCWDHALLWLGYMLDDKCGYFEFGTVCLTICAPRLRQVHNGIMTCIISTFHFYLWYLPCQWCLLWWRWRWPWYVDSSTMVAFAYLHSWWWWMKACTTLVGTLRPSLLGCDLLWRQPPHIGVSGCRWASTQAIPVYAMKWDEHVGM